MNAREIPELMRTAADTTILMATIISQQQRVRHPITTIQIATKVHKPKDPHRIRKDTIATMTADPIRTVILAITRSFRRPVTRVKRIAWDQIAAFQNVLPRRDLGWVDYLANVFRPHNFHFTILGTTRHHGAQRPRGSKGFSRCWGCHRAQRWQRRSGTSRSTRLTWRTSKKLTSFFHFCSR